MENKVYELLDKLNIEYTKIEHPPIFNCKDTKKYNIEFNSLVCKNLFINSSKRKYYFVVLPIEKKMDLKHLQILLGETRLSFSDEKILEDKLGVKSGSVSIFNVINLKDKDVVFLLDEDLLKCEKVAFHPNTNTVTVLFDPKGLNKILGCYTVKYKYIKI